MLVLRRLCVFLAEKTSYERISRYAKASEDLLYLFYASLHWVDISFIWWFEVSVRPVWRLSIKLFLFVPEMGGLRLWGRFLRLRCRCTWDLADRGFLCFRRLRCFTPLLL